MQWQIGFSLHIVWEKTYKINKAKVDTMNIITDALWIRMDSFMHTEHANQYQQKDKQLVEVWDARLAYVSCSRYSKQLFIVWLSAHVMLLASCNCSKWPVFRDIAHRCSLSRFAFSSQRARSDMSHLCKWWRTRKPQYSSLVHRTPPPLQTHPTPGCVRHSVILSQEVRISVKSHFHNGSYCSAKHRS